MERSVRVAVVGGLVAGGLLLGLLGAALARPVPRGYAFLPDHPVDLMQIGPDRWAYYAVGEGESKAFAARVRPGLVAEGYREDATRRPWFRFVRGDREVVVCDHDEFSIGRSMGTTVLVRVVSMIRTPGATRWPCVLVKNGPERSESLLLFRAKKLALGW